MDELKDELETHVRDADKRMEHHDTCLAKDQSKIRETQNDIQFIFSMLLKLVHNDRTDEDSYKIRSEIEDHLVHKSLGYGRNDNEY